MRSLRSRFILSHILPLLLIVPLIGVTLIYLLETQVLLTSVSGDLTREAQLIAETVYGQPDLWQNPELAQELVARIGIHTDGRLVLMRPNGELVAASDAPVTDGATPTFNQDSLTEVLSGQPKVAVTYGLFRQTAEALVPVKDVNQQIVGIVAVTQTLQGIASQFGRLRWWIVGILGLELLLGTLIGLLLALRLERPIDRAATAVIEIAHGKQVEVLPLEGPQEIRQLSESVNILSDRLRVLEETRQRSLANIVHELGRPLGAVRAAVHVLRGGVGEDPTIREELLEGVEGQIDRMQPLLDDLAQLHGQVSGHLSLMRRPVPLGEWLPPILLPWRAAALEKGLQWTATVPAMLPTLDADPDKLARVVGNLLSNAVKYTPAGGCVSVEAGSDALEAWIRIGDTGPGIALEEQARVFEPFYRSDRDRRFPQGLGLGLTIARDLVTAHGGTLELVSQPGEGSRFTVHLPLRPLVQSS